MIRVDSSKPCQLVYALCKHEYLSYVIEPHIVQLNPNGEFSLSYQRIFSNTAEEFLECIEEADLKLIRQLDDLEQGNIIKKYYKKPVRPFEFFSKVFDEKLFDVIRPKLEKKIGEILKQLKGKPLYLMSKEGYPVERKLEIADEPASVIFHFLRDEVKTDYFPIIRYQDFKIEFMFKDAEIVCNHPAWMLLDDMLYWFEADMEGKKLLPFLNKRNVQIPRATEHAYFERFMAPLIEKYQVFANGGLRILPERHDSQPVLKPVYVPGGTSQMQLFFRYGDYVFPAGDGRTISVRMENVGDEYFFHRIKRSLVYEKKKLGELVGLGLRPVSALFMNLEVDEEDHPGVDRHFSVFDWLNQHHDELQRLGFALEQPEGDKRFVYGNSKVDLEFSENNDWFDVNAIVHFGNYQIPFIQLRRHILNHIREFVLPGGEIAIIPEKWFTQYGNLLRLSDHDQHLRLKRHHIGLVNDFAQSALASVTMNRKLQQLSGFESIEEVPQPEHFNGSLRPYQTAGYDWFHFLRDHHFGGCLADDMGLGKTIQTLALLQKIKEEGQASGEPKTSLIIMPTSLIYNWLNEAKKFVPTLHFLVHTGSFRYRDAEIFSGYDVVITTYGITRIDIDLLADFHFHYIILDESQNIKNAGSKSYKAVKQLKGMHRLVLSGTPVENSVNDLWSQMSFINPGLLGSQQFFQDEFVSPIEKKKDAEKARKLQSLIKPFVLRRTKEQVASELPPKTEQLFYVQMSEDQAQIYEETKSAYRNELLQGLDEKSLYNKQIKILQGLTQLRQIANHPSMIDDAYEGESGKFENVVHTLQNVLDGGHKVLIFSQFVRHLDLFRQYFERENIRYAYLDGATQNRGDVVKRFQNDTDLRVFLISIKAGGVGLNLTEADYVFILDPWWNPAIEQQAIDRTHRIGQTKNVFIYKFITKDSVEEKILALQNRKLGVARSLITTEENFFKSLSTEDIREILS